MQQRTELITQIVGPQHNREDALPERQVQKPDGEEPCSAPEAPYKTVLLNFDLLHFGKYIPLPAGPSKREPLQSSFPGRFNPSRQTVVEKPQVAQKRGLTARHDWPTTV